MADEQQSKPSFRHTITKKALAPVVASVATAATTYLMRKAVQLWHESVQPKLEEKGGAGALAREAADAVSSKLGPVSEAVSTKLSPVSEAVTSKIGGDDEQEAQDAPEADGDRSEERRQRQQRRQQRRKSLEQAGSS